MNAPSLQNSESTSECVSAPCSMHSLRSFLIVCDLVPRQYGSGMKFLAEIGRKASSEGIRMGLLLAGEPIPLVADAFRRSGIVWWSLPDWKTDADEERRWRFITGFRRINALEPWDVVWFNFCNPVRASSVPALGLEFVMGVGSLVSGINTKGFLLPGASRNTCRLCVCSGPSWMHCVQFRFCGTSYYKERRCPRNKIKVVYTSVRVPENQSQGWLRPKLGLQDSVRFLVTVASLIPRKGLDVLLEAVSVLLKEHREWHLLIVGGGPLLGALQEQAHTVGNRAPDSFSGNLE